jgi:prepilin-type N-terminal cleavage/methylation domain-containing protein
MVSAVRRSRGFTQISTRESRGFTLIELLVVTAILVIVSGLVLANHSRFGGKILLQNLAYDMALSVRQAQVYGISVRQFGAGTYSAGYGIRFSTSVPTLRTSK